MSFAPVPDHVPTHVGPYRLLTQLGGGGMGIVWHARHVDTGADVALKTVRLPEPRMLASIRREIHALTRLRHPGVVRVLAQGVDGGLPWYAMELLSGRTLADRIEQTWSESQDPALPTAIRGGSTEHGLGAAETQDGAGFSPTVSQQHTDLALSHPAGHVSSTRSVSLAELPGDAHPPEPEHGPRPLAAAGSAPALLRLCLRLCETLAVLHGVGLVHRDLKPENVFVRDSGEPVLVDFGLAAHGASGHELLEAGGAIVGTLNYMAPEQIHGAYVDARADLYSLGCILYESLTGRPPFLGEPLAVANQHLHRQPDPPSRHVEGVRPEIDELVLRLLRKDPRERAGHAADVAVALAVVLDEPLVPLPGEARRPLYRAGFAGRDPELAHLEALADGLSRGTGHVAILRGPSGAGKTRLLMELARVVAPSRKLTLTGECLVVGLQGPWRGGARAPGAEAPRVEAAPLHPFRDVLLHVVARCHRHGADETRRLLGADLRVLAEFEPTLLSLPGAGEAPEPPALPGEARRQRVLDATARLLVELASQPAGSDGSRPGSLVLLLDDLQWADELTLGVLAALPATVRRAPLLVVAACRIGDEPPALLGLLARPDVHALSLGPLDRAATRSIAADVLALAEPPEDLLERLDPGDAGNPFFVTEVLHIVHDDGLLLRGGDGRWRVRPDLAPEQLPRTLAAVSRRRLDALGPATRGLVDLAAVHGQLLDLELLTALGELGDDAVLDAVDDLIRRRVVQRRWTGDLSFVHEGLLGAAYDALAPERRAALHRKLAEQLEARGADDRALPQLAHHWSHAGVPATAFAYLVRNARRTLAAGAHHQAAMLLEQAWALADASDTRPKAAGEPVLTGARLALTPETRAEAALLSAEAALGLGDIDAAQARIAEVLRLHGHRLPRSGPGWVLGLFTAMARQFTGLARRAARRELPAAQRPALTACARALNLLQQSYVARVDTLRLLATCFMAANTAEASREAANPAIAYSMIGAVCGTIGMVDRADWYFARAGETSRRLGDAHAEVAAGVAECAFLVGACRWSALESRGAELLALGKAIGARHEWEALMMILVGGQLRRRGCAGLGKSLGDAEASALARNNELSAAWVRAVRSECYLWAGDPDNAEADALAAIPHVLRGSGKGSSAVPRAALARAHLARGRFAEAAAEARAALADLRGETLLFMHDPACRLVAEVLLELWARARAAGEGEAEALRRAARQAVALMFGLARSYPFSRAAAQRLGAQNRRIGGDVAGARTRLLRAAKLAAEQDLGLERGAIELELARCLGLDDPGRGEHLRRAREHFTRCHADGALARVQRVAEGRA